MQLSLFKLCARKAISSLSPTSNSGKCLKTNPAAVADKQKMFSPFPSNVSGCQHTEHFSCVARLLVILSRTLSICPWADFSLRQEWWGQRKGPVAKSTGCSSRINRFPAPSGGSQPYIMGYEPPFSLMMSLVMQAYMQIT